MKNKDQMPFFLQGIKVPQIFGIRSVGQLGKDLGFVARSFGSKFQIDASSIRHLRPDLSIPAYAGRIPEDGLSPIMNLFDRTGGGIGYSQRVSKNSCKDFRGKVLSYDEHDGTDFVCPVGTELVAAAPGHIVAFRDRWLRGGLTVILDHGAGVLTQYTHCSKMVGEVGQAVKRGETIAISGASGIDMTTFFPWVAPHVHFMAWVDGVPVDPFLADGEEERPGTWQHKNDPRPSVDIESEPIPPMSEVDKKEVDDIVRSCTDDQIAAELGRFTNNYPALAAILEDSLHHDRYLWPEGFYKRRVRPGRTDSQTRLTLPLSAKKYSGCCFAD